MTAALTFTPGGVAEMAYVGATPWHGLGQSLAPGASIDTWLDAAGMGWTALTAPVHFHTPTGDLATDPAHVVVHRSDNHRPLGIVSNAYRVVQPREVLTFFENLIDGQGYSLDTAGTLFDGRRFWALASIGEAAAVVGHDELRGYLLLSTSVDGTLATTARFTSVRVVCNNTLSMALGGDTIKEVRVPHRSTFVPENVKNRLGLARGHFREFLLATRVLAARAVNTEEVKSYFTDLVLLGNPGLRSPTTSKPYVAMQNLFNGEGIGSTLPGADGTAWGLVNAVTEYVDHRSPTRTPDSRLASAWFGRGDDLKSTALAKALQMV